MERSLTFMRQIKTVTWEGFRLRYLWNVGAPGLGSLRCSGAEFLSDFDSGAREEVRLGASGFRRRNYWNFLPCTLDLNILESLKPT